MNDWTDVLDAVRTVWASVWYFRAFQERRYRGIDQKHVGMAILVHHSFPTEEANGVAITANPLNSVEPGFYINVQKGDASVVQPAAGDTTDEIVYGYGYAGYPATYLSESNLVPEGEHVLTRPQLRELGSGEAGERVGDLEPGTPALHEDMPVGA